MDGCTPGFTEIAGTLGGIDCASAAPIVSVRDPFTLANWTLPVVEALMVAGAVATFIHAVLWWRRRGDPANLALWAAAVGYVVILEPPLYFPDRFGLAGPLDLIFVHNVFSVQFLYDRLPLYILAIYPALTYLAYILVQRTGILDRRHPVVGAACVAFVFHCFYEIFDHIGPQLRWWAWNPDAPSNTPWLASVPLTSAAIFAGASPFGFALLARLLIARRVAQGPVPPWSMALRVAAVGMLTPLAMMLFSVPYYLLAPNATAQAVALWLVISLFGIIATPDIVDLAEIGPLLPARASSTTAPPPAIERALGTVKRPGLLIVVSPTFKGTYSGLLKLFFDMLPMDALAGTVAVAAMTAGWARHRGAADQFLRPLLTELGATVPVPALPVLEAEFADLHPVLSAWTTSHAPTLAAVLWRHRDGFERLPVSIEDRSPIPTGGN